MMKKLLLGILLIFSTVAVAAEDDLLSILNSEAGDSIVKERDDLTDAIRAQLKTPTAEQEALLGAITASKYAEALAMWDTALGGSTFGQSPSGQALKALLIYQNGIQLNGIRDLFAINEPQKILPEIKKVWNLTLTAESKIWAKLRLDWKPVWTEFFGPEVEAKVVSWQVYDPTNTEQILSLISNTKLNTPERYWLEWQMALGLAIRDDSTKAGKVLAHMLQAKQNVISDDLIYITAARLLYEKGYLSPAISYYKKVPKKSDYWFEAQEEIAWSYLRKGEPQNTLAVTQSLSVPVLATYVGPEGLFLRSYAQLKVCDYPETIKSVRQFKSVFQPRVAALQALVAKPDGPAAEAFVKLAKKGRVNPLDLKDKALALPRYLSRDEVTYNLIEQLAQLDKEAGIVNKLYKKATAKNAEAPALLVDLKEKTMSRQLASRAAINERVKLLAQTELDEIQVTVRKMHIVEAEVIQQINVAQKVTDPSKNVVIAGTTGSQNKYSLKFPYEGELWFDEIDSYKVDIKKNCLALAQ